MSDGSHQPISVQTSHAEESAASERMVLNIAPRIQALASRQHSDVSVQPGSALNRDDRDAAPYQVSHSAWMALSQAIDCLQALRLLTVRQKEENKLEVFTLPYSLYPLIRGAFENASRALWLIGPASRNERITRRLRLWITDGVNHDRYMELTGRTPEVTERARRLAEIAPLAVNRGLDLNACAKSVGNAALITGAAAAIGSNQRQAEALWRTLSGLSHGDQWATNAATDKDEVFVNPEDNSVTLAVTSSIKNIANLTTIAVATCEHAMTFYDIRRTRHL